MTLAISVSQGAAMMRRLMMFAVATCFVALLPRTAQANIIAPALVPGIAPLFGLLAIPATILAALCESPFVRRAGVRQQPLFHAFCANGVTTFVGFLLLPVGFVAVYTIGFLWIALMISGSIWIEGKYYEWLRLTRGDRLRWPWIVWGNVVSSAILIVVSVIAHAAETPWRAEQVKPYWWPLLLTTVVGAIVAFLCGLRRFLQSRSRFDGYVDRLVTAESPVSHDECPASAAAPVCDAVNSTGRPNSEHAVPKTA
jgi:hypothetical protein